MGNISERRKLKNMEKNLLIKNFEENLKECLLEAIDFLIYEIKKMDKLFLEDSKKVQFQFNKIQQKNIDLDKVIQKARRKSIFNFTKSLVSKDLRRNIGYFNMFSEVNKISKYSTESAELITYLWSIKEIFGDKQIEYFIGYEKTLISILEELKNLILTEDKTLATKILEDSDDLQKSFLQIIHIINLDFIIPKDFEEQSRVDVLYKIFVIIRNLELISEEINEICEQINYINQG